MAILATALAAGLLFVSCERQDNPVDSMVNQENTGNQGINLDYQGVAQALVGGILSEDEYFELSCADEDDRKELRNYVLQLISEEEIEGRDDIVYIVGPSEDWSMTADEINEVTMQQVGKEGNRNLDWVLYVKVPFYSQNDPDWSGYHLGYSNYWTIGNSGCYLCCVSMHYAKWGYCPPQCPSMYPPGLNNWSYAGCSHYAFQNGTAFIQLPNAINYPGVCRPYGYFTNVNLIWSHLQAGHPVMARYGYPPNTHYVVIFGYQNGRYYVKDPLYNAANQNQPLGNVTQLFVLGVTP